MAWSEGVLGTGGVSGEQLLDQEDRQTLLAHGSTAIQAADHILHASTPLK